MLFQPHRLAAVAFAGALLGSACSASLNDPAPSETERQQVSERVGSAVTDTKRQQASQRMGNEVSDANLPISKRFASLDAYLAYLEKYQGPVDGPWYKLVGPDRYELQTGNLRVLGATEEKRIFTRAELEKQFGFTK